MGSLTISQVEKRFGDTIALQNISLTIGNGEFFSLLGPSGSGKTTLLRTVAGFHVPDKGEILVDGRPITWLPPHKRDLAMVFQNYALFPHRTTFRNVAFGLEMRGVDKAEIDSRVMESLKTVQLQHKASSYPGELSGGQQQRVAIARSIVLRPSLLLMDEPLSALDRKLRSDMQLELRELQQELGITTLYVTHDQEEALSMSDRIAVMRDGMVVQVGSPQQIYEQPRDSFVADFMGSANIFVVDAVSGSGAKSACILGYEFALPNNVTASATTCQIAVRPERMKIGPPSGEGVRGRIAALSYRGSDVNVTLETEAGPVRARYAMESNPFKHGKGDAVSLSWAPSDVMLLEA